MKINVRKISARCQEVEFSGGGARFESGVLDQKEAVEFASHLLDAASDLLDNADKGDESVVIEYLISKL